MIVFFRAAWAVTAVRMERDVWTDRRALAAARSFVALKIDVTETDEDAELYADRYAIQGMPATVLFDSSGRRVAVLNGEISVETLVEALNRADE